MAMNVGHYTASYLHFQSALTALYSTGSLRDDDIESLQNTRHYENTPMQYTTIFHGCKNDNFQSIFLTIFIFLLKRYIVGTR